MTVRILLFSRLREETETDRIDCELAEGATVADVIAEAVRLHPGLQPWREHIRVAVNHDYVLDDRRLFEGDEVAFITPVSGG